MYDLGGEGGKIKAAAEEDDFEVAKAALQKYNTSAASQQGGDFDEEEADMYDLGGVGGKMQAPVIEEDHPTDFGTEMEFLEIEDPDLATLPSHAQSISASISMPASRPGEEDLGYLDDNEELMRENHGGYLQVEADVVPTEDAAESSVVREEPRVDSNHEAAEAHDHDAQKADTEDNNADADDHNFGFNE